MKLLRPSLTDFEHFDRYIDTIAKDGKYDEVVKIIPPTQWLLELKTKRHHHNLRQVGFDKVIQQNFAFIEGTDDNLFKVSTKESASSHPWDNVTGNLHHSSNFNKSVGKNFNKNNNRHLEDTHLDKIDKNLLKDCPITENGRMNIEDLEKKFWQSIKTVTNVKKRIKDYSSDEISLNKLLQISTKKNGTLVSNELILNESKTTSTWNLRDTKSMEIYFLHSGSPRLWYSINKQNRGKFHDLVKRYLKDECATKDSVSSFAAILNDKSILISPEILRAGNIEYGTIPQYKDEFIIVFPSNCCSSVDTNLNLIERLDIQLMDPTLLSKTEDNTINSLIALDQAELANDLLPLQDTKLSRDRFFELGNNKHSSTDTGPNDTFIDKNQTTNSRNSNRDLVEPPLFFKTSNYDTVQEALNFGDKKFFNQLESELKQDQFLVRNGITESTLDKILVNLPAENPSYLLPSLPSSSLEYSNQFIPNNFNCVDNSLIGTSDSFALSSGMANNTFISASVTPIGNSSFNSFISKQTVRPIPDTILNHNMNNYQYILNPSNIAIEANNNNNNNYATSPALPKLVNPVEEANLLGLSMKTNEFYQIEGTNNESGQEQVNGNLLDGNLSMDCSHKNFTTEEIIKTRKGSKLFKCQICKRIFSSGHHLTRHKKCVHSNVKPYACPRCDKRFKRKDHVMQHLQKKQACKPV